MKPFRFFLLLVSLGLVNIQSKCKPDPDPIPKPIDPCANGTSVKADFDIFDRDIGSVSSEPTDTVSTFVFTLLAKQQYDSCKWTIGSDTRIFTGQKVSLYLPDSETGSRLVVRMIATRKPSMRCLNNDNGIDTITKSFVVAMPPDHEKYQQFGSRYVQPLMGMWEGSTLDQPSRKFKINIVYIPPGSGGFIRIRLYNFPEGAGDPTPEACGGNLVSGYFYAPELMMTHNTFIRKDSSNVSNGSAGSAGTGCLPAYSAHGRIDPANRNRMTMNFITYKRDGVTVDRKSTFIGLRK